MPRSMPAHPDPSSAMLFPATRIWSSHASPAYAAVEHHGRRRYGHPHAFSSSRLHRWPFRSRDLLLSVPFQPRPFPTAE